MGSESAFINLWCRLRDHLCVRGIVLLQQSVVIVHNPPAHPADKGPLQRLLEIKGWGFAKGGSRVNCRQTYRLSAPLYLAAGIQSHTALLLLGLSLIPISLIFTHMGWRAASEVTKTGCLTSTYICG